MRPHASGGLQQKGGAHSRPEIPDVLKINGVDRRVFPARPRTPCRCTTLPERYAHPGHEAREVHIQLVSTVPFILPTHTTLAVTRGHRLGDLVLELREQLVGQIRITRPPTTNRSFSAPIRNEPPASTGSNRSRGSFSKSTFRPFTVTSPLRPAYQRRGVTSNDQPSVRWAHPAAPAAGEPRPPRRESGSSLLVLPRLNLHIASPQRRRGLEEWWLGKGCS